MSTRIRLATADDAEQIAAIYAPVVRDTAISFELDPPPAEEMRRRIEATLERLPWIVHETDDTIGGYAYAGPHRARFSYQWSVEVSAYVRADARRTGVGRSLYSSLFAILRLQRFVNLYAGITLPNAASVGLHESLGFEPVGVYRSIGWKFGQWHDVGWWQLPLTDHLAVPAPPLAIHEVFSSEEWNDCLRLGLEE